MDKTNVMRILEQGNVKYSAHYYGNTDAISGLEVSNYLGEDIDRCFKTLVTRGKENNYYVFMVPSSSELNLKKAAVICGEKSIEMVKSKDLFSITGYVHGGCSPIGMKKMFPTYIDETANLFDTIYFSGGKIGYQIELNPKELSIIINLTFADIC